MTLSSSALEKSPPQRWQARGLCSWPWARLQEARPQTLQGGEAGPCHRPGTQLDRWSQHLSSSLRWGSRAPGSCFCFQINSENVYFPSERVASIFSALNPTLGTVSLEENSQSKEPANRPRNQCRGWRGARAGWLHSDRSLLPSSTRFLPISSRPDHFLTSIIHTHPHLQNPSGQELLIHTEPSIIRCSVNTGE